MASPPIDLARIRQLLADLDQLFCDHPELGETDPARYHQWLATHLQEGPTDGETESVHQRDTTLQPDHPDST
ncbi:MAG TPA: hypothetical protein VI542_03430 [Candidatus Tectomicrobia bacterium]